LWLTIDGLRIASLCLSYADDAFFIVVIDLDLPTIYVSLHKGLQVKVWIGADEERGFAVKEFRSFAEAISDGFDDDKKQRFVGAGFAPEHRTEDFDLEVSYLSDGEAWDLLKGD